MQVITIQPITERPFIDAIASDDFLVIGDASDNDIVKRVFISEITNLSADKLAIADYSFNTLPDKPATYPHAPIDWSELQGKPLTFPPSDHSHSVSRLSPIQLNGNSLYEFDVPLWATEIQIPFSNMSTNGSNTPIFQLGTLNEIETTGYLGGAARVSTTLRAINNSNGFLVSASDSANTTEHGIAFFTLLDPSTNTWTFSSNTTRSDIAAHSFASGSKALSGSLRRVRLTTNSANIFDNGVIAPSFK